jgi:hypothetical protein
MLQYNTLWGFQLCNRVVLYIDTMVWERYAAFQFMVELCKVEPNMATLRPASSTDTYRLGIEPHLISWWDCDVQWGACAHLTWCLLYKENRGRTCSEAWAIGWGKETCFIEGCRIDPQKGERRWSPILSNRNGEQESNILQDFRFSLYTPGPWNGDSLILRNVFIYLIVDKINLFLDIVMLPFIFQNTTFRRLDFASVFS